MHFTLNGEAREWADEPDLSLLDYLRDVEGLRSPKSGCSPEGSCGACTVLIDGKPTLSCVTPMRKVARREVTTTEGLAEFRQRTWARAFVREGGVQCGYCTPGIVMRLEGLVRKQPAPDEGRIRRALIPHLCRCTGYQKIVTATQTAARHLREGTEVEYPELSGEAGTRLPKYDAEARVLGRRDYVADMVREGMLHAALHYSDHPRARVLSVDTRAATAAEGVEAVLTVDDVPGERHVGLIAKDWPVLVGPGDVTRYVGDVLAVVVATSRARAQAAARLVEVEYEVLEPVLDPFEAMADGAPELHEGGNLLSVSRARKGDFEEAWGECAHRVEGTWRTPFVEHAYLEPECALAEPGEGGVRVFSQSQGVYQDRDQIASVLGLPVERVRVELVPNGGGFGGKEDLSVQGHTALAAYRLGRPVRLELSRDESLRMHPKRHPITIELALGCTAEGRLHALRVRNVGDTGAYASVGMKVLERSIGHASGAYDIPHVDAEARAVYTNNVPCGAMRGFGANQANFALEGALDMVCEQGGFDRWQIRWDNALTEGRATATGQVLTGGVGLRATLEAVKADYDAARICGIACGLKNTGIGNGAIDEGRVRIDVVEPGRLVVHHGWTEMGQGCDTIAIQFVCEELGLDPALVDVRVDTREEVPAGMTTASRATSLIGHAVIDACRRLRWDLHEEPLAALVGKRYHGHWSCDWTTRPGTEAPGQEIHTHYSYSYATQLVILTEEGTVERIVAAHDVGRVMNANLFEGQVEGSVHMGLGHAMTEALPIEGGHPTGRLGDCGVLRAHQMPPVEVIPVEVPCPNGPLGAKGVGEIGLVPTPAAVANAYAAFEGVRRFSLPLGFRPDRGPPRRGDGGGSGDYGATLDRSGSEREPITAAQTDAADHARFAEPSGR